MIAGGSVLRGKWPFFEGVFLTNLIYFNHITTVRYLQETCEHFEAILSKGEEIDRSIKRWYERSTIRPLGNGSLFLAGGGEVSEGGRLPAQEEDGFLNAMNLNGSRHSSDDHTL